MKNKIFLDSNILLYLYSTNETTKKSDAHELIKKYKHIYISTQVLFEFTHITHKKFKYDYHLIEKALKEFKVAFNISLITFESLQRGIHIALKYNYSFVDSLIIATALQNECTILFTEDMHAGQLIEKKLKIVNPFS